MFSYFLDMEPFFEHRDGRERSVDHDHLTDWNSDAKLGVFI